MHVTDQSAVPRALIAEFHQVFGASAKPRVFQAPGRVNLIGEHTDYNEGFVMPVAIDFHTWIAAGPREDAILAVHSVSFGETKTFDLRSDAQPAHHWSDYIRGVAVELQRSGSGLMGANLLVDGNVPIGSGLSSSASVEVATACALSSLSGIEISRRDLAQLCQRAENDFVGARVGIMDQFVSTHGECGRALMLDCRSLDYELIPLPQSVSLVICNTGVKHKLAGGEYNVRRRECEQGVALLQQKFPGIKSLRDITPEMLQDSERLLSPNVYRRCRHVVTENARVMASALALRQADLAQFGRLMYLSHESLRDDYEVSCRELDLMVAIASNLHGVIGARMTGGGFGGCTVNLVANEDVETFQRVVAAEYQHKTGIAPQIYVTTASGGASEMKLGETD